MAVAASAWRGSGEFKFPRELVCSEDSRIRPGRKKTVGCRSKNFLFGSTRFNWVGLAQIQARSAGPWKAKLIGWFN
jgi:hypothetical protein